MTLNETKRASNTMVHVYMANVIDLPDPLEVPAVMVGLPEDRIEKICRYKQAGDRRQSLGAGILLKTALRIHGISTGNIRYGENGKPEIDDIFFNLSHSHDMVVCAISEQKVGCDVERIKEANIALAERFFAESEVAYLKTFDRNKRVEEFFRLWTMKESYVKMTGEGMKLALDQFEMILDESVKVIRDGKLCPCHMKEYDVEGYKVSVCAEETEFAEIRMLSIYLR